MEGMFVEMDRGGGGVLTHGKRQSMCVLSILKFACSFVQANQSSLFTFQSIQLKSDSDEIVQRESTRSSGHLMLK